MSAEIVDQPPPVPNDGASMHDLVSEDLDRWMPHAAGAPALRADLADRKQVGLERYGTTLQAGNGRNALVDAYQEALDLLVYLRQAMTERGWPSAEAGGLVDAYVSALRSALRVRTLIDSDRPALDR